MPGSHGHHRRRRRPVPSQVNTELAQEPGHAAYLMGLREETSDAATAFKPSFTCLATVPPSLGRTVLVIMGVVVRHGVMSPHSQSPSSLGVRGTNFHREGKNGGSSPLFALGHADPIFGLTRIQPCAAVASRGTRLRRRDHCPHILRFIPMMGLLCAAGCLTERSPCSKGIRYIRYLGS